MDNKTVVSGGIFDCCRKGCYNKVTLSADDLERCNKESKVVLCDECEGDIKVVEVTLSHDDVGNCRTYYRTIPRRQLICAQDEGNGIMVWYTVIDDGYFEEPDCPIDTNKYIIKVL